MGLVTDEVEIEWERPVITPMLDIRSIGAGGGSIAWIDDGGSLRVGPQSAGADPGPACYGRGGTRPTVTDANLVLGRIDPTLGGKLELDRDAATNAIETVAEPLGMTVLECAEGIAEIVSENMAMAIRSVSVDRGRDPRDHVLVAFGGAGGLHAYQIARSVGIDRVLVPPFAGVACAFGATTMDVRHDLEATFYAPVAEADPAELMRAYSELEGRVRGLLEADGVPAEEIELERSAMMRYVGQSYEVDTPVSGGALGAQRPRGDRARVQRRARARVRRLLQRLRGRVRDPAGDRHRPGQPAYDRGAGHRDGPRRRRRRLDQAAPSHVLRRRAPRGRRPRRGAG